MKLFFTFARVLFLTIYVSASSPCIQIGPGAESLCIPIEVINSAFRKARLKVDLTRPFFGSNIRDDLDEIDKLGLALSETSKILAREYDLSHDQIYYALPNLNLGLTDIPDFCPKQFTNKLCKESRFRSISGHCNSVHHPDWGASLTPFTNIIPPHKSDGVGGPRDEDEFQLPPARVVSAHMHTDTVVHDHVITTMLIAWGQIIDHDITLTAETKDGKTLKEPDCCKPIDGKYHHNCFPIRIPSNDPFYSNHGHFCMNFLRSLAGVRSNCRLGPRVAFNQISSFLDSNFLYGSDAKLAYELRLKKYGFMKSLPFFREYGLKDILPLKTEDPDDGCIRPNKDVFCFLAGDNRVNEQLILAVLHTIFLREHNRIASRLGKINRHWDDERIYQETRHIIIAITQQITYDEFLPMVLGKELMQTFGLSLAKEGYWDEYNPNVNPTATDEFVTSAFRFGHSLLPNKIERWTTKHHFIEAESLSKLLRQPYDIYRPGFVDTFVMGLVNQLAQAMDEGVTDEVTNLLFKEPNKHFGMDLAAMNIQRGREHGIPGYVYYREICGLHPIHSWDNLYGVMNNETISKYKYIYKNVEDIDLWSGGVSEIPSHDSLLGPTFGCIIALQFQSLKFGDRFWFERPDEPSTFTPSQLSEIRNMKLSRLLCDNTDHVTSIQVHAMILADPKLNPRVSCKSREIPRIDLEQWREDPPYNPYAHVEIAHSPPTWGNKNITPSYAFNGYENHKHDSFYSSHATSYYPTQDASNYHHKTQNHNQHTYSTLPSFIPSLSSFQTLEETENNQLGGPQYEEKESDVEFAPQNLHQGQSYLINENIIGSKINYNQQNEPIEHVRDELKYSEPTHYWKLTSSYIEPGLIKPKESASVRVVKGSKSLPKIHPFPPSPFPGMDGIFSPNPGYLVKQRFVNPLKPSIKHWNQPFKHVVIPQQYFKKN